MKLYEKSARYFLGVWFLICAVDGWAYLIFNVQLFGGGRHMTMFYLTLINTTWLWVFVKIVQTIGTISLLFNYKPALGLALITPISAVLCLFYVVYFPLYTPISLLITFATIVLFRAYWKSYAPLWESR